MTFLVWTKTVKPFFKIFVCVCLFFFTEESQSYSSDTTWKWVNNCILGELCLSNQYSVKRHKKADVIVERWHGKPECNFKLRIFAVQTKNPTFAAFLNKTIKPFAEELRCVLLHTNVDCWVLPFISSSSTVALLLSDDSCDIQTQSTDQFGNILTFFWKNECHRPHSHYQTHTINEHVSCSTLGNHTHN